MNKAILPDPHIDPRVVLGLYLEMYRSRCIDRLELEYANRGEAFFHVSGAGHEAMVALNPHLGDVDYLHCHYRDKALMLARGVSAEMFFMGLFCKDGSHSRGRQMSAHLSARELNLLSLVGPVGNNALQAVGVAAAVHARPGNPIVLCAAGEGSTQEGEFLEAVAEAVRCELPVLFVVEDNGLAISTATAGRTFYDYPDNRAASFYGIPITEMDGTDVVQCHCAFGELVRGMRADRKPRLAVFKCERLSNHTNADDQRVYRDETEIVAIADESDPVAKARGYLLRQGVDEALLSSKEAEVAQDVERAAVVAFESADPVCCRDARCELRPELRPGANQYSGEADTYDLNMLEAIRGVLKNHLEADARVSLYGQDIEDPKGDVFGLTRGLSTAFPGRVKNSPLSEATIVGTAVGRALAGETPVAFLQFADFLPIAFNQIISEMGSMYWRTDGSWQCPVIVMVACGAYRPGLGTFHAQTMESIVAHVPGVDVMMPSTAGDAAAMLNTTFQSARPTIFFYPKSCLTERAYATSTDLADHVATIPTANTVLSGDDITFVAYGNAVHICREAIATLEKSGVSCELIDLRFISPWDVEAVTRSAQRTGRLVVVHEDNHTCGMGAEIIATVTEKASAPVKAARVTRPDTYIPCNFTNQLELLPSYPSVLQAACRLLGLELEWAAAGELEDGFAYVRAIGTSPSDSTVKITEWHINVGDTIRKGDLLADYEADKAAAELLSSVDGVVVEILVDEDESCDVGDPILKLTGSAATRAANRPPSQAIIKRPSRVPQQPQVLQATGRLDVAIAGLGRCLGARKVANEELLKAFPDKTYEDVVRGTGIESRYYAADDQTVLTLAVDAARSVLAEQNLSPADLDMLIVASGTPDRMTPSLACRVLAELADGDEAVSVQAMDINAACSAYLYAMQTAYDYLQSRPGARVAIVTTEVLSRLVDPSDYESAFIFGDAATATVLNGHNLVNRSQQQLYIRRPVLGSSPECGKTLGVPLAGTGEFIRMTGKKIFTEAVRKMIMILGKAAAQENLRIDELNLIVPHQANKRIINAIAQRLDCGRDNVFCNIEELGNTSSNTIPLALMDITADLADHQHLGLCCFGGGFTYGAAILEYK